MCHFAKSNYMCGIITDFRLTHNTIVFHEISEQQEFETSKHVLMLRIYQKRETFYK